MSMTKKDFELIAETISNLPIREELHSLDFAAIVKEFADMCASTNGNFDRGRFTNACNTINYRAPRNVTRY